MGKRPEQTTLPRRHTNGQQVYENVLNITNHQGNATQNHNAILPHICQNGYYQKKDNKYQQEFGEKGTLVHYW